MTSLKDYFNEVINDETVKKITLSKPSSKSNEYKKIVIEMKTKDCSTCDYQISKYTQKQVFHENISSHKLAIKIEELTKDSFRQINACTDSFEHIVLISKDGKFTAKKKKVEISNVKITTSHNRKKNYLIEEGQIVPPLIDMGIFTKDGKIVKSMYDKFRQINRFLEILDDEIAEKKIEHLNIIDFGCGKSYLTFVMYYYFTQVKKISVNMIGLDLKEDVIKKCNESARKYGYDSLSFEMGDINGFKTPFDVDMVVTLHACDVATDYALYNAITWNAKMIFSVPCCQHELNNQLKAENLSILGRYGIIKERFSALATDAIRANLLEYSGYKTQLLEFVDFAHTPKNILIRAVKRPLTPRAVRKTALGEIENLRKEFNFDPTLYKLLIDENKEE